MGVLQQRRRQDEREAAEYWAIAHPRWGLREQHGARARFLRDCRRHGVEMTSPFIGAAEALALLWERGWGDG